ncbi:MAG TPA: glycoside hydrolase family 57 protein [Thermoanaerobaculia bacterium]|nr:glycoside hydrolase family 57 protein [Thermoanaerobaculia bacterium]
MSAGPLRVFFLWHFHQPWYADFAGGPTHLPWVRLHALKDYADLPALLSSEPRVPHACNLVPSLLDQIEVLSRGGSDLFLDVARTPAEEWDGATVAFALANFFSAHHRMIEALPRLAELKRRLPSGGADLAQSGLRRSFSRGDLRDLVVLFHLAWSGQTLSKDPLLAKLRKRGHGFSEEEKNALLDRQEEFLSEVIPAWKRALATGNVELTTSPYHHPILPLLVDSTSGREARPDMPLPHRRFARPDDAREQLALGLSTFERHFGFRPGGMWPPEGAVSEPALALMAAAGVRWVATDEDVLLQSLFHPERHFGEGDKARTVFHPYRLERGDSPVLFFRDRILSDRIGFSYATWDPAAAAADFIARLHAIRAAAPDEDLVVPVILDGENAWETYPENGAPFLHSLAATLAADGIRVMKPSDVLREMEPRPLTRLVAGSWVDGNLRTWVGAPAKNRAWDLLTQIRDALAADVASAPALSPPEVLKGGAPPAAIAKAALFAAEASDWFWWFGDDHTSAHDAVFDALFRGHLITACRALGRPAPPELDQPVERRIAAPAVLSTSPLSPHIDGEHPDFFEWLGAGRHAARPKGTMERGLGPLKEILFGGDAQGERVFICLNPTAPPASTSLEDKRLRVVFPGPGGGAAAVHELALRPGVSTQGDCSLAVGRVAEIALPRPKTEGRAVAFRVHLLDGEGRELETIPDGDFIRFETEQVDWSA